MIVRFDFVFQWSCDPCMILRPQKSTETRGFVGGKVVMPRRVKMVLNVNRESSSRVDQQLETPPSKQGKGRQLQPPATTEGSCLSTER